MAVSDLYRWPWHSNPSASTFTRTVCPLYSRVNTVPGSSAVADLGITTISDALHLHVTDVTVLQGHDSEDTNVRLTMTPHPRRT